MAMENHKSTKSNQQSKISINCSDPTPLGLIWVAVSDAGLAAVEIGGEREEFVLGLQRRGFSSFVYDPQRTEEAVLQLQEYLAGQRREFDLPVDWSGMREFQRLALRQVCAIPYGEVTTYGEIARRLGKPRAARAVGRANAANPLPLVIPCHRLLGSDGKLHGYGAPGGIKTKEWLLRLERGK
jgi:methylated-DNA-[protein]-cysteine S-methyltransferase